MAFWRSKKSDSEDPSQDDAQASPGSSTTEVASAGASGGIFSKMKATVRVLLALVALVLLTGPLRPSRTAETFPQPKPE